MEKIIGCCGIICSDCPVLIATKKNDDSERRQVAQIFTKQYRRDYKPQDINCEGCLTDDQRIFSYCNICEIRCGKEKNVRNCAFCTDYPCEKLSNLFAKYRKAKATLDETRREIGFI